MASWARVAVMFVMISITVAIGALVFEYQLLQDVLDGHSVSFDRAQASDMAIGVALWWLLSTFVAATVLLMQWVHAAWRDALHRRAPMPPFTPAWAVIWWFMPMMNFWIPVRVMSALWRAGRWEPSTTGAPNVEGPRWEQRSPSPAFGWWWGLFVAATIFFCSGMMMRTSGLEEFLSIESLMTSTMLLIISMVLYLLSGLLLIAVIRSVQRTPRWTR